VLQAASIVSSDDRFSGEPMGTDADWSADSNLVSDPSWISGTVAKNVLTVAFKQGTSMARQEALIASVHGEVIDEMDVRISDVSPEYTIRVPRIQMRVASSRPWTS